MHSFLCNSDKPFAIFTFSHILWYRESIVIVKKFEFEISMELFVLRSPESKKVVFIKCLYVCMYVCMSVCPYPELQQKLLVGFCSNLVYLCQLGSYRCTRRDFEIFQKQTVLLNKKLL